MDSSNTLSSSTPRVDGVDYKPTYQRYVVQSKNFVKQYSHLYQKRIRQMRPSLLSNAKKKWGTSIPYLSSVVEIEKLSPNEKAVVVGTIYKEMNKKPNILRELENAAKFSYDVKDKQDTKETSTSGDLNFVSSDDVVVVEDESGRVQLDTSRGTDVFDPQGIVTGVVLAIRGIKKAEGGFQVTDTCFPSVVVPPSSASPSGEDAFVLLVSGLNVGSTLGGHLPHLLADYVTGHLGGTDDAKRITSRIARVVVVGNSADMRGGDEENKSSGGDPVSKKRRSSLLKVGEPLQQLDLVLSQMLASVPVDVMPGERDPTNFVVPQQPLHPCLLPHSSRYSSFRPVTNPYACEFDSVRFLGMSGQNVNDILRCTSRKSVPSALDACANILRWAHLAPTAPDTLGCYPFFLRDPFIIDDKVFPDVLFAGNCRAFETKLVESGDRKTRVVCLPAFNETGVAALVNLKDLSCVPLSFSA
eukprot:g4048.t1